MFPNGNMVDTIVTWFLCSVRLYTRGNSTGEETGVPDYVGGVGGTGGEIQIQSFVAGGLLEGNQI